MQEVIGTAIAFYILSHGKLVPTPFQCAWANSCQIQPSYHQIMHFGLGQSFAHIY